MLQRVHDESSSLQLSSEARSLRSKSRVPLQKTKSKPMYLTDTQISSSDQTKSSSDFTCLAYEKKVRQLEKENAELKESMVQIKAAQFYELDEQKIRILVRTNDSLRNQIEGLEQCIEQLKSQNENLTLENEYLSRNNRIFKENCRATINQTINTRQQRTDRKEQQLSECESFQKAHWEKDNYNNYYQLSQSGQFLSSRGKFPPSKAIPKSSKKLIEKENQNFCGENLKCRSRSSSKSSQVKACFGKHDKNCTNNEKNRQKSFRSDEQRPGGSNKKSCSASAQQKTYSSFKSQYYQTATLQKTKRSRSNVKNDLQGVKPPPTSKSKKCVYYN